MWCKATLDQILKIYIVVMQVFHHFLKLFQSRAQIAQYEAIGEKYFQTF